MDDPRKIPDAPILRRVLVAPAGPYAAVDVVESTGSTNADLLALPEEAAADRTVLISRFQESGRGRLGRSWSAPKDTQLALSVLYRPEPAEIGRLGLLPLVAGLAVSDVIPGCALKWPNDVLMNDRKLCGILAEAADLSSGHPKVALGFGVNTSLTEEQLPVPTATSLRIEGEWRTGDVTGLARDLLLALDNRIDDWRTRGGRLPDDYRDRCITIGRRVRLETPSGDIHGDVRDVTDDGEILIVDDRGEQRAYSAGDVTHLRPAGEGDPGSSGGDRGQR